MNRFLPWGYLSFRRCESVFVRPVHLYLLTLFPLTCTRRKSFIITHLSRRPLELRVSPSDMCHSSPKSYRWWWWVDSWWSTMIGIVCCCCFIWRCPLYWGWLLYYFFSVKRVSNIHLSKLRLHSSCLSLLLMCKFDSKIDCVKGSSRFSAKTSLFCKLGAWRHLQVRERQHHHYDHHHSSDD